MRITRVISAGAGRVHTSTISVAVIPDAETADFEVKDSELRVRLLFLFLYYSRYRS